MARFRFALGWLISRSQTFLDDDYPNEVARAVRTASGKNYESLDHHVATAAIVARLLYRTGEWTDSHRLILRHVEQSGFVDRVAKSGSPRGRLIGAERARFDDQLSLLRTWVTMSAKLGAEAPPLEAARILGDVEGGLRHDLWQTELLTFAALGHRTLQKRSDWSDQRQASVAEQAVDIARRISPNFWPANLRALRLVILAAEDDITDLVDMYLSINSMPPLDDEAQPLVGKVLVIANRKTGRAKLAAEFQDWIDDAENYAPDSDYIQSTWKDSIGRIIKTSRSYPPIRPILRKVLSFDHRDWVRPFGNALSRAFDGERGGGLRDALVQQAFLAELRGGPALDGLSITQWAAARGSLLRLAATIDQFSEEFAFDAPEATESYPETVFGIAEALLQWHDVNPAAIIEIKEPPELTPKAARKRRKARPPAKKRAAKTARRKT
ncbi:hypothetical protein [Bradyrhizobium sp. S3.2.12]|uniref:hypothetical protein n=1 Tax=Bradyrhizobium sp. S3.2.12 TaxID=3156387 RepID=UPI00339AC9F1